MVVINRTCKETRRQGDKETRRQGDKETRILSTEIKCVGMKGVRVYTGALYDGVFPHRGCTMQSIAHSKATATTYKLRHNNNAEHSTQHGNS